MVSFFKEKSPLTVLSVIAVSIALHAHFLIHPPQIITNTTEGLIYYLISPLKVLPSTALTVIYQVILLLQSLLINFIVNDSRMLLKPAFTTALAYILLSALLPQWNNISSALTTNFMIIWLLYSIIKLYNAPEPKTNIFNTGLIAGITCILYYASAPVLILVFFAVGILRPFRMNEWVVLLLGILTPAYFLGGFLFLTDKMEMLPQVLTVFYMHLIVPDNILHLSITFITAGIIIIYGIILWQQNSTRMVVQVRKNWAIIFLMLILLFPSIFFIAGAWPSAILLLVVPACAFVSAVFLYSQKNIIAAIFFWALVAVVAYNNWVV